MTASLAAAMAWGLVPNKTWCRFVNSRISQSEPRTATTNDYEKSRTWLEKGDDHTCFFDKTIFPSPLLPFIIA